MTTTTNPVYREVTPDEAITSVIGYLRRSWERLAADHVSGATTASSLRELRDGLAVMERRLQDVSRALDSGGPGVRVVVTDLPAGVMRCTVCGEIVPLTQSAEHASVHPPGHTRYREVNIF